MAFGDWVVGVFLRFESNGAVTMARLASSTKAANEQLLRQQGLIDANSAAMLRYQRRIEEIRLAQMRAGTMMAGGVALAGVGGMAYAISQAADLQRALTTIKIATGANDAQMAHIRDLAYDVSNMTAQSVTQSAQIIGVMASSGINKISQLNKDFVTAVAQFADVQFLKTDGAVSFEEATRQGIQLAHLYQAYSPQQIKPILDTVTKLSFMMPDSLNRYLTQAGYYTPLFRRMGVPEDQSLIVGAFLDKMGVGRGKGGTALQDFVIQSMNALQQTAHAQAGHRAALERLGIVDSAGRNRFYTTDAKGNTTFDLFGELQQINKALADQTKGLQGSALTQKRADFINDLLSAFKVQGARFGFLATPAGVQQLLDMIKQLGQMPGTAQAQSMYMDTFWGQFQRAMTNIKSVITDLGGHGLTPLTGFFRGIGDMAHNLQVAFHDHPTMAKTFDSIFAGVTVLASARFVAGVVSLGGAIAGFGRTVDAVTTKILRDELILGGGAAGAGAAGLGGAAAATEGVIAGLLDIATLGLYGMGVRLLSKLSFSLTEKFVLPFANFFAKIGPWGQAISDFTMTTSARIATLEGAFGGILGPLGLFTNGLKVLAGPLGWFAQMLQWTTGSLGSTEMGWGGRVPPGGTIRGIDLKGLTTPTVNIRLQVDLKGGSGKEKVQTQLRKTGAFAPFTNFHIQPGSVVFGTQ